MKPGLGIFFRGKKLPVFWPYIVFFCFSLVLFTGLFYLRAILLDKIGHYAQLASQKGLFIEGLDLSIFPPVLKIARASLILKNDDLLFTNLEIAPLYSDPALKISGSLSTGQLIARVSLSSFFKPDILKAEFDAKGLPIEIFAGLLGKDLRHVRIQEGMINISGQLEKGNSWMQPEGKIDLALSGGVFNTDLPFFKKKDFTDVNGKVGLLLAGRLCNIQECVLRSGEDYIDIKGSLDGWQKPAMTRLDIDMSMHINSADLEENMIPAKLMAKIKKDGIVSAHIGQTLTKPSFKLEK